MINRILMELYDDYEKGSIDNLVEFTKKTFPQNGTDKLFIGCVLILFSRIFSNTNKTIDDYFTSRYKIYINKLNIEV